MSEVIGIQLADLVTLYLENVLLQTYPKDTFQDVFWKLPFAIQINAPGALTTEIKDRFPKYFDENSLLS